MPETKRTVGGSIGAAFRAVGRFIKRHRKLLIFLVVVAIAAVVAWVLLGGGGANAAAAPQVPQTTVLARMDLQQIVAGTGTLQSSAATEVTSGLSYDIAALHVEDGDWVQAGQLLATLDTTDLDKDIADLRESIAEAKAKDALSLSQAERKLQDAINARDINQERNEAAVENAADAIEAAREAAGEAALESAAVAAATDKSAEAKGTLTVAQAALTAAQTDHGSKEAAWQLVAAQQEQYNALADAAGKAALLQGFGYADEAALAQALADAETAKDTAALAVQAAEGDVDDAQKAYDKRYDSAYKAYKKNNEKVYTKAYENADVSALQTAYDNAVQSRDSAYRSDSISIENAQDSINTQKLQDSTSSYQTQLEGLLEDREDCEIVAPTTGKITDMTAEVGKSAGGSAASAAGAASALFTIEDTKSLEVTASIPEYDVVNLRVGMPVTVTSDALPDGQWSGTVRHISTKATDTSGNFTVTVAVDAADSALAIGMSAKINIIIEAKEDVFAVPYDAVTTNAQGENVVYVLDQATQGQAPPAGADGRPQAGEGAWAPPEGAGGAGAGAPDGSQAEVKQRAIVVQTGMEADYYIEIISDELTEGMLLLTDPEGKNVNTDADAGGFMMGGMGMPRG